MPLRSEEVNYLVYRYLQESGFSHAAYVFAHESHILKAIPTLAPEGELAVSPGALVAYIQKGLRYEEIDAHVNDDGSEVLCEEPFSVLKRHVCAIKAKRKLFDPDAPIAEDFGALEVSRPSVLVLSDHVDAVSTCVWSTPQRVCSASLDGTAKVWDINAQLPIAESGERGRQAITTLACNAAGVMAWGNMKGSVWMDLGEGGPDPLTVHDGPVTSLSWGSEGLLLSTGIDGKAVVWTAGGDPFKTYAFHKDAILDAVWGNRFVFATCSKDGAIVICDADSGKMARLQGHMGDVNAIRFDPSFNWIASAGDDATVRLWNVSNGADSKSAALELRGHLKEVSSVCWIPSLEQATSAFVASGSYDTTVKLWDPERGQCVRTLDRQLHPVSALGTSADQSLLGVVANDRFYVWSTKVSILVVLLDSHVPDGRVCEDSEMSRRNQRLCLGSIRVLGSAGMCKLHRGDCRHENDVAGHKITSFLVTRFLVTMRRLRDGTASGRALLLLSTGNEFSRLGESSSLGKLNTQNFN